VPFFSADGQSILFDAPGIPTSSLSSLLDRLFGIIVAEAHGGLTMLVSDLGGISGTVSWIP